jgi:bisphosphoglycerate-dependent phosphoglycerate mutase
MYRLSENGVKEAHEAGKLLKKDGYTFDVAFSSVLQRANKTEDYRPWKNLVRPRFRNTIQLAS